MKKIIFWVLLLGLLSLVPLTVIKSVSVPYLMANRSAMMNLVQRIFALTAFVLLFWQIMLGAYMQKWTDKLGGWVFKFHVIQGTMIYALVFLHPVFFMLFNFFAGRGIDPFYVFTQVCVFCKSPELYYSLGRVSFWLINIAFFAGLFRTTTPYMRANWRKFHIINYLVFLLVGIHGFFSGTDFRIKPFFTFAIIACLIVVYTIIRKLPSLVSFLKNWLRS